MNNEGVVSRLFGAVGVRTSELPVVVPVVAVFAGTQSTHALSANTGDALFFSRFGVEHLPTMYIVLGVVTMATLLGYTAALSALGRRTLYCGLLAVGAVVMVALRVLVGLDQRWVFAVIWLAANLLILVTLTFMWNLAGDVADARSAKRLFPVFASAGILGGVLGNVATGPLAAVVGTANLLLVTAAIFGATAVVVRRAAPGLDPSGLRKGAVVEVVGELGYAARSPLLRLVGVAVVLATTLFYLVTFPFSEQVATSFDTEAGIAGYLGLFAATATAATFLLALLITNRLFASLGVLGAWLLVAATYVAGFTLWLTTLTLVTASIFRFAQWVVASAIGETARSAVFNVLRSDRRGQIMAAFAAVPAQLGVVLAGALLLVGRRVDERAGSTIGLVLAAGLAFVIWRMRRHYTDSLVQALREGMVDTFTAQHPGFASMAADADTMAALIAGTRDEDPQLRRISADIIGRTGTPEGVAATTRLLDDDDVDVRLAALEALERLAETDDLTIQPGADRVLSALFPQDGHEGGFEAASPATRARAAAWLARVNELTTAGDVLTGMLESSDLEARRHALSVVDRVEWAPKPRRIVELFLDDPALSVRAAAARPVAVLFGANDELHHGFFDPDPMVRLATGGAWRDVDGDPEPVLSLLESRLPHIWEAATIALGGRALEVRDRVMTWAGARIVDLIGLRAQHETATTLVDDPDIPAGSYLAYLLEERMLVSHRVAIRVLALLEPEETVSLIIDGLRSVDTDTRAQALEAAETVGGDLGHQIVPILEGSTAVAGPTRNLMQDLVTDDDPWIRILALRCVAELAAKEWATVIAPATHDPDERVSDTAKSVLARMDPDMTKTVGIVGRLDRMLLLRKVPIFESLLPEDLERLASAAVEHTYQDGEVIFQTDDPSQELLLIIDGAVDLGPKGHPMFEQLEPGNHVGELAALCGLPRATNAIARGPTRVLAIEAATLDRLLKDRPEVTRQMLSDLAERLAHTLKQPTTPS